MRIISGQHKGRKITAPAKLPARPTTDMAKEGLFNILNNRFFFDQLSVLDLFSGTGNIAYEFASRGATDLVCVDQHKGACKFIEKTASSLQMPISVICSDVFKYLKGSKRSFDLIFADPPYGFDKAKLSQLHGLIQDNNYLNTDGIFILEHSDKVQLEDLAGFTEVRKYGGSCFSFFDKNAGP